VDIGVNRAIEMLAEHGVRGTFFVLGWIGQRYPELVRRLADAGHEIASHGWGHRKVTDLTAEEFRTAVRRSKAVLEDLAGVPVLGYRAPSFSIVEKGEWALDVLVEEGYRYDSSLYPVSRLGYGYATGQRGVHVLSTGAGPLVEVPPTTLRLFGYNLPAAGGAYFRWFPYRVTATALRQADRAGERGTFYIHPWELDREQPRLPVGPITRLRHYGGLNHTLPRLRRLLRDFQFTSIDRHPMLASTRAQA
jgi:polysaccharide deacetylase family protein (PEP-CTERM system associated)